MSLLPSLCEIHHPDEILVPMHLLNDPTGLEQSDVLGGDIMVQVGQAEVLAPLAAVPSVPQLLQQVGEGACAVLGSRSLWQWHTVCRVLVESRNPKRELALSHEARIIECHL